MSSEIVYGGKEIGIWLDIQTFSYSNKIIWIDQHFKTCPLQPVVDTSNSTLFSNTNYKKITVQGSFTFVNRKKKEQAESTRHTPWCLDSIWTQIKTDNHTRITNRQADDAHSMQFIRNETICKDQRREKKETTCPQPIIDFRIITRDLNGRSNYNCTPSDTVQFPVFYQRWRLVLCATLKLVTIDEFECGWLWDWIRGWTHSRQQNRETTAFYYFTPFRVYNWLWEFETL